MDRRARAVRDGRGGPGFPGGFAADGPLEGAKVAWVLVCYLPPPDPKPLPAPEDPEEMKGFPGTEPGGSRGFAGKAMQTPPPRSRESSLWRRPPEPGTGSVSGTPRVWRFSVSLGAFASTSSFHVTFINFFTVQILIYITSVQKKKKKRRLLFLFFIFLVIFVDLFYENFQVSLSPSLRSLSS